MFNIYRVVFKCKKWLTSCQNNVNRQDTYIIWMCLHYDISVRQHYQIDGLCYMQHHPDLTWNVLKLNQLKFKKLHKVQCRANKFKVPKYFSFSEPKNDYSLTNYIFRNPMECLKIYTAKQSGVNSYLKRYIGRIHNFHFSKIYAQNLNKLM